MPRSFKREGHVKPLSLSAPTEGRLSDPCDRTMAELPPNESILALTRTQHSFKTVPMRAVGNPARRSAGLTSGRRSPDRACRGEVQRRRLGSSLLVQPQSRWRLWVVDTRLPQASTSARARQHRDHLWWPRCCEVIPTPGTPHPRSPLLTGSDLNATVTRSPCNCHLYSRLLASF